MRTGSRHAEGLDVPFVRARVHCDRKADRPVLMHLGRDQMAAILRTFSNPFPSLKNILTSITISQKFVRNGPIDNKPALVQIMAWRRINDKLLPVSMMTQLNGANMRHLASMS